MAAAIREAQAREQGHIQPLENNTFQKIIRVVIAALFTIASFAILPPILSIIVAVIIIGSTYTNIQSLDVRAREAIRQREAAQATGWNWFIPFWRARRAPPPPPRVVSTGWFGWPWGARQARVPLETGQTTSMPRGRHPQDNPARARWRGAAQRVMDQRPQPPAELPRVPDVPPARRDGQRIPAGRGTRRG